LKGLYAYGSISYVSNSSYGSLEIRRRGIG